MTYSLNQISSNNHMLMPYYSFLYIKIEKNKISTHPLAMFITAKSYSLFK
jgi:hypothetical protein